MCLFTNNLKFKTAKKDIVCYKVLRKDWNSSTAFTPYRGEPVEFDKILYPKEEIKTHHFLNGCLLKKIKCLKNIYIRRHGFTEPAISYDGFYIGSGIIHLYATYNFAIIECYTSSLFVCKAIIPKGAKYIVSSDGRQIGATCVKYEKL